MEQNKFVNPYNFISLPDQPCVREKRNEEESVFRGYIECTLETKTPLFVPASDPKMITIRKDNGNTEEHPSYDFFQVNGKPVIPGSELRGMIRNVYETVTNSCYSTSQDLVFTQRDTMRKGRKPGILRYDTNKKCWVLEEAVIYKVRTNQNGYSSNSFSTGDYVSFRETEEEIDRGRKTVYAKGITKTNDWRNQSSGILKIGNLSPRSRNRNDTIFSGTRTIIKKLNDDEVASYLEVLKLYDDKTVNKVKNHNRYKAEKYLLGHQKPHGVYYSITNNFCYMSPAAVGRTVYNTTLYDILGRKGYTSCGEMSNLKELCPGCRLFGITSSKGDEAGKSSRVRISDANCVKNNGFINSLTLKELAVPKYSNRYLYFNKMKDFDLTLYDDGDHFMINGRKFYWHNPNTILKTSVAKTNLNKTIRPMKEGSEFSFKVYFDNITETELDALAYSLNFGDNNNDNCHKLGSGKPLGLGSTKVKIKDIFVEQFDLNADSLDEIVSLKPYRQKATISMNTKVKQEIETITKFSFLKNLNVSYPIARDQNGKELEGFKWFMMNHSDAKDHVAQYLPSIQSIPENNQMTEKSIGEVKKSNSNSQNRNNNFNQNYRGKRR